MNKKIEQLQKILGTELSKQELYQLHWNWKAFVETPERYAESFVTDCVVQWLKEYREAK